MTTGSLPGEGDLQLGSVRLPAGKRVTAGFDTAVPVAWVTRQDVRDAGRVWAALSAATPQTGLVPFLLGSLPGDAGGPGTPQSSAALPILLSLTRSTPPT